jgi:hypothetical protein
MTVRFFLKNKKHQNPESSRIELNMVPATAFPAPGLPVAE